MRRTSFLATAWGALLTVACHGKPVPGSECRVPTRVACLGPNEAVVCEAGRWSDLRCGGAKGCTRRDDSDGDDCDDTIASIADPCPLDSLSDYACTADRAEALVCDGARFRIWRNCRGARHCEVAPDSTLRCDTTLGQAGDPCETKGAYACSLDRLSMLACDGRQLFAAAACRGPDACAFDADSHK